MLKLGPAAAISEHKLTKGSRGSKPVEPKWIASKIPDAFQSLKMISLPSELDM